MKYFLPILLALTWLTGCAGQHVKHEKVKGSWEEFPSNIYDKRYCFVLESGEIFGGGHDRSFAKICAGVAPQSGKGTVAVIFARCFLWQR